MIIDLTVSILKTVYNASNCLKICLNIAIKLVIHANYHDIAQLLPLTIIVSSKKLHNIDYWQRNITINRQNWLISHPYHKYGQ